MRAHSNEEAESIVSVSIRLSGEQVYSHTTHYDAMWVAFDAGAFVGFDLKSEDDRDNFAEACQSGKLFVQLQVEEGFLTNRGRFVGRDEAYSLATQAYQLRDDFDRKFEWLDASDLKLAGAIIQS
jgi:hypothetical protein